MNNQQNPEFTRSKKMSSGLWKLIVPVLIVAAIVFCACYFIFDGFRDQNDPAVITEKVGKHIMLPNNETPTITTVENASELVSQPFFSGAKDGDKILIYATSARIIIYRPTENILVNVGPIVDDSTDQ